VLVLLTKLFGATMLFLLMTIFFLGILLVENLISCMSPASKLCPSVSSKTKWLSKMFKESISAAAAAAAVVALYLSFIYL
jgi:HD-like signal output (HDOD) protein